MTTQPTPTGTVSRIRRAVHLERRLDVPRERVWTAWTDPERLERWLGPVESGVPADGATFVLRMADDEVATCAVHTWEPPHLLEITWTYTGEGPSRLRLQLHEVPGGTHLVLDHQLPEGADAVEYGAGWHVHLDSLTADLLGAPRAAFHEAFPLARAAYEAVAEG